MSLFFRDCRWRHTLQTSVSYSDIELCRQALLALPKSWLIENIETSTAQILKNGTDEKYRRILELYIAIDLGLAGRLAKQALEHEDPDVCEVGEDFDNQGYFILEKTNVL